MNFWLAYKMAIKSILGNKTRSMLTMLGVIIGVAAVIAAVGFAEGSMATVTQRIEGMGSNMINVLIRDTSESRTLSLSDLDKFVRETPYINEISPYIMMNSLIKGEKNNKTSRVIGTNSGYLEIAGIKMWKGRFITDIDIEKGDKVAVIGVAVKNKLFDEEDAIGKNIRINGVKFLIVGVLESVANGVEGTDDDMVMIPINVAQRTLKITTVNMFLASASSTETIDLAINKIKDFLYDIYRDEDNYIVFSQEAMLNILGDISSIMMTILGSIATISLVVGGIGIMNIMLVSVTERTREIGIRKAIGAKKKNIMIQFLIEALTLTGIGGVIGIIFGMLIIKYIIGSIPLITPVYSVPWTIAAFTISLIIGVAFGIFPAHKASKLHPIEALRNE